MGDLSEHFDRKTFECQDGCGKNNIDSKLIEKLERMVSVLGRVPRISSGCRCVLHSVAVGGGTDDAHVHNKAVDIPVANSLERYAVVSAAVVAGFVRIGDEDTHVHVDVDSSKVQNVMWRKP